MPEIEIVCLANSRKLQGRCIAGLRTDGGGWTRPVVQGGAGTLFPDLYRLPDGTEPRLLDVIRVGCIRPHPEPHQPENWYIDGSSWELVARPAPPSLRPLLRAGLVRGPALLGDSCSKTHFDQFLMAPAPASLALVVPRSLQWRITTGSRGGRRTKACFWLDGAYYELSVSDPLWEQRLEHLPLGLYDQEVAGLTAGERLVFTISFSEPAPWDNCCYKLVAAVIVVTRQ